jgi:ABC-type phosphate/phosphonate transport system permease subunit
MSIHSLNSRSDLADFPKVQNQYLHFQELIKELNTKQLNSQTIEQINVLINQINTTSATELKYDLPKTQSKIIKLVEKESKIVPKNYYRKLWMTLGMAVFGVPIGVAVGTSLGNMGLLAIWLPVGMAIGISVGTSLDKKAEKEGRQLNWEAK